MTSRTRGKPKRDIDWDEVRKRVVLGAARQFDRIDPAREHELLAERARVLATPVAADTRAEELELVTFTLTGEHYALESSCVLQVIKLQDMVRLPGAPEHLLGVTNLRGEILPVFDLRVLLGLSRARLDDMTRLLVL